MQDIGALGEQLIVRWLELHNCKILQQNWHCRWGEIDIIAQDSKDKTILFVEVKTRSKNNWDEDGVLAINSTKQEKIINTASLFLAKYSQLADFPCRFDAALISYIKTKQEAEVKKIEQLQDFDLGMPVEIASYQLTIKKYIQSAFEA